MEEDEEEVADDLVVVFLLVLDFLVAAVLDPAGVLFVLCLGLSVTASTLFAPASSSMFFFFFFFFFVSRFFQLLLCIEFGLI